MIIPSEYRYGGYEWTVGVLSLEEFVRASGFSRSMGRGQEIQIFLTALVILVRTIVDTFAPAGSPENRPFRRRVSDERAKRTLGCASWSFLLPFKPPKWRSGLVYAVVSSEVPSH